MHYLLLATLVLPSLGVRLQSLQSPSVEEAADGGRRAPPPGSRKLAWFHPPATGTSFGTTLFHYANASLPIQDDARLLLGWAHFFRKYKPDKWFRDGLWYDECDHAPVTDDVYEQFKGHFVGLFRSPQTRIISHFHRVEMNMTAFLKRTNGSVALQLAGQAAGEDFLNAPGRPYCIGKWEAQYGPPPRPHLDVAVRRLREGFKFVGLTEEFDLSVCLFHAIFGGECLEAEFDNMRPSGRPPASTFKELDHLQHIDQVLYDIAVERFWADVKACEHTVGGVEKPQVHHPRC